LIVFIRILVCCGRLPGCEELVLVDLIRKQGSVIILNAGFWIPAYTGMIKYLFVHVFQVVPAGKIGLTDK